MPLKQDILSQQRSIEKDINKNHNQTTKSKLRRETNIPWLKEREKREKNHNLGNSFERGHNQNCERQDVLSIHQCFPKLKHKKKLKHLLPPEDPASTKGDGLATHPSARSFSLPARSFSPTPIDHNIWFSHSETFEIRLTKIPASAIASEREGPEFLRLKRNSRKLVFFFRESSFFGGVHGLFRWHGHQVESFFPAKEILIRRKGCGFFYFPVYEWRNRDSCQDDILESGESSWEGSLRSGSDCNCQRWWISSGKLQFIVIESESLTLRILLGGYENHRCELDGTRFPICGN